jgi:hypothetical protein
VDGGYYFFATLDMNKLKINPDQNVGFLFRIGDFDGTPNLYRANWEMNSTMIVPHDENFSNWSDARNCFELKLAK